MEKKFNWSVEISTPQEFPVQIYRGHLGKRFLGTTVLNSTSWGGGIKISKRQAYNIPETLDITWLSLIEQKFYTGKWTLPKDKIKQLFERGFEYNKDSYIPGFKPTYNKIDYTVIQIGLAPKGVVVVWLIGGQNMQVEIGRFQAHQTTIDPKKISDNTQFMFKKDFINEMLSNPEIMTPEITEKIRQVGYPLFTVYDAYREKYHWKPKVILPKGSQTYNIDVKMCNGEKETTTYTSTLNKDYKAIPYLFKIIWKDKEGKRFVSKIVFIKNQEYWKEYLDIWNEELPLDFDKNEIRSLFKNKINKNTPSEIVIKIDNEHVSDFYLEQADKQYPITEFSQDTES
ncbi:DUF2931 family protein [Flavobacterium sp. LS1R49]|uniref:DUF2931 family protein n=1 Tax=Flavobacterium shii TaxID=2987687 RepID=A0A9X3C5L0_9FLAO|nr:DUF2931 family protein [Flavobacterium shii]MCV9930584.1 DUF2931 family protein [Flavobacterium shii]